MKKTQTQKEYIVQRQINRRWYTVVLDTPPKVVEPDEVVPEHECLSVTTPDGHGAYCAVCGETLA